jgi:quercetin 2,3-dioxygenase
MVTSQVKQEEPVIKPKEPIIKSVKPMGFQWETMDPFLFCVHHEDQYPKGNGEMGPAASLEGRSIGDDFIIKDGWRMYHGDKVPGFPGHPHRGFETITVVRKGLVDHSDSLGASGRYGEGDVQWMTAGKGVQHAEMFPLVNEDKENPLELFQIWLNLPAKDKMVEPHFKMLWGSNIPKVKDTDAYGRAYLVEVIAGQYLSGQAPSPPPGSWASNLENGVCILNIHLEASMRFVIPASKEKANRMIYFYEGEDISVEGNVIHKYHSVHVDSQQDLIIHNGNQNAKIFMLQGKPIEEVVISYGPFVMNSKEEIQQAFNDYHETKFGGWPWDRYDVTHGNVKGRFAKHSDGRYEEGV